MDIPGNTMAPERIIQHLYWGEELSQELVAERLGCSPSLIYKQMKTLNIPTRTRAQAKRVAMKYNRINIRENYQKRLETMREEIRIGLRQWKRPGKHKTKITALEERTGKPFIEILRSLYWDEQMSCRQIAEYLSKITADLPGRPFEIDKSYVSRRLKMYDIPRRDISEATKLAMRGLKLPY